MEFIIDALDQVRVQLCAPLYDDERATRDRESLITHHHSAKDRCAIHSSLVKGLTEKFKAAALDKNFSMLEEVSKTGYGWTPLHFASHYGHAEILRFLIEYLSDCDDPAKVFNIQTVEGKTPLFCAITSGAILSEKKKEIIEIWFETGVIDFSLRKKSGEDLLELASKNNVYDHVAMLCSRED